jgi:hypothetical protein
MALITQKNEALINSILTIAFIALKILGTGSLV